MISRIQAKLVNGSDRIPIVDLMDVSSAHEGNHPADLIKNIFEGYFQNDVDVRTQKIL